MSSTPDLKLSRYDKEWRRFGRSTRRLLEWVVDLEYDGMTALLYSQWFSRIADWPGFVHREGWRGFADFTDSDRYLLPQRRAEWLSVDALFRPLPIPGLPGIRESLDRAEKKALQEQIDAKNRSFQEIFDSESARLDGLRLRDRYLSEEPEAIAALIELAHRRHPIGRRFRDGFRAFAEPNAKVVLVEIQFPDFAKHSFQIDTTAKGIPKYASETQSKKIVRRCLYSVVIRAGYLASRVLEPTSYKTIAINVSQDWFDPATGLPRSGIICSLQAQVGEFLALNLAEIDPEACFRHLKGIAVPSFDSISPIRPIFVLNKNDDRFIATRELDSLLAPEANLAAMPWEDFEQLVAQLFEWEFAKEGVEVRVTRVSRDRGVDAVLFDPDPLRGGKFVLQAKRYTSPVDVAAVRDLYGTVVNEGANRGILITTSSYGPDSYAFAKDKPISLVDGPNLLVMLRRHGKKFRIDLEEARSLNQEKGVDI
jgi:restriction system protein